MSAVTKVKENFIDLIKNFPSDWELSKNKYAFLKISNGKNMSDSTDVLSLTISGIKIKEDLTYGKTSESYIGHQLVKVGDLVFTPRDFDQTPILSDVSKYDGCISNLYIVDKPNNEFLPEYINYFWYGLKYSFDYFKNFSYGIRFSFNRQQFDEIPILKPSLDEQKIICTYLDIRLKYLDTLVDKVYSKIGLLTEQRTAIVNHFITKGLDPNVEMKDSGIEWIGQIPNHWGVKKLKHFAKIYGRIGYRGYTVDDIVSEGKGAITLGPGNIKDNKLNLLQRTYISNEKYEESPEIQIFPNDVIFVKTGSTIGKSCIVEDQLDKMTLNPQMVVLKDILINNKFFFYQTTTQFFQNFFETEKAGGSTPTISQEKIRNFPMLNVPVNEQEEIVNYLNFRIKKIEDLINLNQQKIKSINEYRQSLIASVVTGKVRVTKDMI